VGVEKLATACGTSARPTPATGPSSSTIISWFVERHRQRGALAGGDRGNQEGHPNKPIRYVINTHAHYDHAGGLRTYVAQGATVITHELNKPFFEKVWRGRARSHLTRCRRRQGPQPSKPSATRKVLTDGTRTIELYHMKGTSHNVANLLVYMPAEKLLFWADGYNPPAGDDPRDPARTPEQMIDL